MFEEISEQTNIYASQIMSKNKSKRLAKWVHANKNESKNLGRM